MGNNVVDNPLKLNDVDAALMETPREPRCPLPKRPRPGVDGRIDSRELDQYGQLLEAYGACWQKAYAARDTLARGLQSAVRVRQEAAAKAVAAAKL